MIDWIVPVWRPDKHRQENLRRQSEWIGPQANIRIVEGGEDFNKQWLCNRAVRDASDWFFIADMDVIGDDPSYVTKIISWAKKGYLRWCFGWRRLIYRGKDGSVDRDDWPNPGVQEGGVVLFSKGLWEEMGGANEWIRELRGPDNDLALRARYVSGTYSAFPTTLTHQWHPRSKMKKTRWRKNNDSILKYTNKFPWRAVKLLKMQKWGGDRPYCDKSFYESRQNAKL